MKYCINKHLTNIIKINKKKLCGDCCHHIKMIVAPIEVHQIKLIIVDIS